MKTSIRFALPLITFLCLAIVPPAGRAVVPAADGGYPGGNTAEGQNALLSLTTGGFNTAVGWFSLKSLTTGSFNTGIGAGTLVLNSGDENTATGVGALLLNTTGGQNTANGALALFNNTEGIANTANGVQALFSNTSGNTNTAIGAFALQSNTTGSFNTAYGYDALINNTGTGNIALGASSGLIVTTASNVICIGADGANVSGSCFIGNISGVTTANNDAVPVVIDSAGQLGTMSSSLRFKKEVKPMEKASEAILALKPVTFHYRSDKTNRPEFGLIAEEVAKVNPDLVVHDKNGEIYSVRYDQVNAMLLNEFLKEHKKVEDQQAAIAELNLIVEREVALITQQQKGLEAITARVAEQAAQMREVLGLIELSQGAPQVVSNKP